MKLRKNYLTAEEMGFIVEEVCNIEGAVNREVLKVSLVAQILIEDLGEFEDCTEIYNKLTEENSIEKLYEEVINIYTLEDLIQEELGVNNFLKGFLKGIEEKLDTSIKDINLEGAIEQLKEISEGKVKKVGTSSSKRPKKSE